MTALDIFWPAAAAIGLAILVLGFPGSANAEQYNVCEWEEVPPRVLHRITSRSDFDVVLERMFESCPTAALELTNLKTGQLEEFFGEHPWQDDGDDGSSDADKGDKGPSDSGSPDDDGDPDEDI